MVRAGEREESERFATLSPGNTLYLLLPVKVFYKYFQKSCNLSTLERRGVEGREGGGNSVRGCGRPGWHGVHGQHEAHGQHEVQGQRQARGEGVRQTEMVLYRFLPSKDFGLSIIKKWSLQKLEKEAEMKKNGGYVGYFGSSLMQSLHADITIFCIIVI